MPVYLSAFNSEVFWQRSKLLPVVRYGHNARFVAFGGQLYMLYASVEGILA